MDEEVSLKKTLCSARGTILFTSAYGPMVRHAVHVLARLDHLGMTVNTLTTVLLQADLAHLLGIGQERLLESKHPEEYSLPVFFVVSLFDFIECSPLNRSHVLLRNGLTAQLRNVKLFGRNFDKVWLLRIFTQA